jgi:hypothetical protein
MSHQPISTRGGRGSASRGRGYPSQERYERGRGVPSQDYTERRYDQAQPAHINKPCHFGKDCNKGTKCPYLHDDAQDNNKLYKTKLCKNGRNCTYGSVCVFVHPNDPQYEFLAESRHDPEYKYSAHHAPDVKLIRSAETEPVYKQHIIIPCESRVNPQTLAMFIKKVRDGGNKLYKTNVCTNSPCMRSDCAFVHADNDDELHAVWLLHMNDKDLYVATLQLWMREIAKNPDFKRTDCEYGPACHNRLKPLLCSGLHFPTKLKYEAKYPELVLLAKKYNARVAAETTEMFSRDPEGCSVADVAAQMFRPKTDYSALYTDVEGCSVDNLIDSSTPVADESKDVDCESNTEPIPVVPAPKKKKAVV